MAKIDRATEMVNNHSTEEILLWLEQSLRRGTHAISEGRETEADMAFLLGQVSVNLRELYDVVVVLNTKLNPSDGQGPVVAG